MKCPVCRAVYRSLQHSTSDSPINSSSDSPDASPTSPTAIEISCRRCGADLTPLIRLHDQAIGYHRQALQDFQQRHYAAARASNDQAIALHHQHAQFHVLSGHLWALEGNFGQAIAAWKTALRLDPQNSTAQTALQFLQQASLPQ